MNRMKDLLERVLKDGVSMKQALQFAVDIENGMLEKHLYQIKEGDDEELARTLKALEEDTVRHLKAVKEKLDMIALENGSQTGD